MNQLRDRLRHLVAPPESNGNTRTVTSGETLWSISQQHRITKAQLQQAHNMQTTTIRVGQVLIIPNGGI